MDVILSIVSVLFESRLGAIGDFSSEQLLQLNESNNKISQIMTANFISLATRSFEEIDLAMVVAEYASMLKRQSIFLSALIARLMI